MGQFIVSARKYRPGSFETLVGQDNIARTLKNSVLNGQLAHAYLFCGPRGVGKTSTARIFAKTINCSNPGPDMEPCGECESCRSFEEGRSYCIHELDAASNNSVDDIRNLTDQVRIPPQIGKYSVYIIDEVHMLSSAAFNAFLKTLEEPPAHAIFILATTEKHKIIPTILSRCQTYDFSRISIEDMVNNMKMIAASENVTISDDALHIIAGKADGAMRDALTLFDQTVAFCGNNITYDQVIKNLNVLDYEYYFKFTDYFLAGDYASALLLFDEVLTKGFNALHFISGLSSHFRDMIVSKNGATKILATLAPSVAAKYDSYSSRCSVKFLYDAMAITTACEAGYKASGNPRLLIEFALMKICQTVVAYENGVQVTKEKSAGQIATPTKPQQTESAKQPEKVTESTTSQQPQQSESQATTQPITPQKAEETVQPQEP
ncbi:MAG: DNA polymerase III subunit gamma/tau, partial [Bacteroidales bacterium]|nr:DNA polymerase III subunit gamma/tau [Bacteroidales bacterium]